MGDAVKDPEIARNFGCLPEQLLERVRRDVVAILLEADSALAMVLQVLA
jgi:hypothetical protein